MIRQSSTDPRNWKAENCEDGYFALVCTLTRQQIAKFRNAADRDFVLSTLHGAEPRARAAQPFLTCKLRKNSAALPDDTRVRAMLRLGDLRRLRTAFGFKGDPI